jgi:hypothetical protein
MKLDSLTPSIVERADSTLDVSTSHPVLQVSAKYLQGNIYPRMESLSIFAGKDIRGNASSVISENRLTPGNAVSKEASFGTLIFTS